MVKFLQEGNRSLKGGFVRLLWGCCGVTVMLRCWITVGLLLSIGNAPKHFLADMDILQSVTLFLVSEMGKFVLGSNVAQRGSSGQEASQPQPGLRGYQRPMEERPGLGRACSPLGREWVHVRPGMAWADPGALGTGSSSESSPVHTSAPVFHVLCPWGSPLGLGEGLGASA